MKTTKAIDQLFEEFLSDQKARLRPKTHRRYKDIIDLYRSYLESYWPNHSQEEYNAITDTDGTYCGTFGTEDIASGFAAFLDDFMPRKVIAGDETMKAAGTVIKKLAKWLVAKGYTEDDESMGEMIGEVARDLPASQKLLDDLCDWLADSAPVDAERQIEGHFVINRIGLKEIWLDPMLFGDSEIGPIPVPAKVAKACKVGWDIGGVVGLSNQGWRLIEVWNISP
jgi:hypothetical protein